MPCAAAYAVPRAASLLITATTSFPACARIASIIHSRAMLLAPTSPQPSLCFMSQLQ